MRCGKAGSTRLTGDGSVVVMSKVDCERERERVLTSAVAQNAPFAHSLTVTFACSMAKRTDAVLTFSFARSCETENPDVSFGSFSFSDKF